MKILGIETSCDETAAAVIEDGTKVLSNVIVSQIDIHKAYGGVIPEIAARSHIEAILPVIDQAVTPIGWDEIDAIAVTNHPGLLGSLLIGTLTARTLAITHNKPLYGIHHIKSHIYANWLETESGAVSSDSEASGGRRGSASSPITMGAAKRAEESELSHQPQFPAIALVVSGGHTQLIHLKNHTDFEIIGTTRDDAVGEAFDKVAKILGLPYPGGPSISKAAQNGNSATYKLPHPQMPDYDFSFSGLKTATLRAIQKELGKPISFPSHQLASLLTEQQRNDFAASFETTSVDILVEKLQKAVENYHPKSVLVAGGVAANQVLRKKVAKIGQKSENSPKIFFPAPVFSTDNAAMVASAAFFEIQNGKQPDDPYSLETNPTSKNLTSLN